MTTPESPENFDLINVVKKAVSTELEKLGHANVLIAGRTGVGKSTLINVVFQGRLAETGQGKPVTQQTKEYTKKGMPISIFDTQGLEIARYKEILVTLESFLNERKQSRNPNEHIHVAWVCISEDSRRIEDAEEDLVKMLAKLEIPVIAVITKARADEGFRATVKRYLPSVRNAISVRAIEEELDGDDDEKCILRPKGLKDLVDLTIEVIPEGQVIAFTSAQKVNNDLKKTKSHLVVVGAAATAATAAIVPIPFAHTFAILPIEVAMLASISAIFGLPIDEGFLSTLVGSLFSGGLGALAGPAIVAELLKFLPGVGSVAGGVISSSTAAALTTVFGEAYIFTLDALFLKNDGEPPTPHEVAKALKQNYSQKSD